MKTLVFMNESHDEQFDAVITHIQEYMLHNYNPTLAPQNNLLAFQFSHTFPGMDSLIVLNEYNNQTKKIWVLCLEMKHTDGRFNINQIISKLKTFNNRNYVNRLKSLSSPNVQIIVIFIALRWWPQPNSSLSITLPEFLDGALYLFRAQLEKFYASLNLSSLIVEVSFFITFVIRVHYLNAFKDSVCAFI